MKTLEYGAWVIEYDDDFTRQIFGNITGGTKTCGCGNCKNFDLARDKVYPEDFRKILRQLGIDYQKETEICQYNRIEPGRHFYGGWFHFIGEIKNAPKDGGFSIFGSVPDSQDFAWSFQCDLRDLVPKEFGHAPVVQLNWLAIVPWVMEEEEPT